MGWFDIGVEILLYIVLVGVTIRILIYLFRDYFNNIIERRKNK